MYRVHHTPITQWKKIYDTIEKIADKFKITSAAIKDANPNIPVIPNEGSMIFIPIARVPIPFEHVKVTSIHEKVWNFFINKGFSEEASAGIMANLQQESEMDPTKKQYGGGPGRGIGQWEETRRGGSGRWNQLLKLAGWSESRAESLEFQLEYILKDLKGDTDWIGAKFLDDFGGYESLKKMSIYQAVVAFECSFELAGNPVFHTRFAYANIIYRRFARGVGRARA
ncbi:phage tail tip lysozyme [Peribacillus butanolivorans]|uniref:phage tail tip lysozyme n=1 Tax=Peribacillus butanolivorans TaxID=421767 RepID=UPI0039FC48ED